MARSATIIATIALLALYLAAGGLSTARAAGDCSATAPGIDGEEASFLAIINQYRASNGAGPLAVNGSLNRAADWMVHDMGAKGYFGHTDSLGRSPWTRILDCGYPVAGGENLAAGTVKSTGALAFEMLQRSPAHNENMLRPEYTEIGIARANVPGSQYGWYWAMTFGSAKAAPAPPPPPPPPPAAAAASAPVRTQPQPVASTQPALSAQLVEVPEQAAEATPLPLDFISLDNLEKPAPRRLLAAGTNLVPWRGETISSDRFRSLAGGRLTLLAGYDHETGRLLFWSPRLPSFLNTLDRMLEGSSYFMVTREPAELFAD